MDRGISAIIVTVILTVITVAMAGGFYLWSQSASDAFEQASSEDTERGIQDLTSQIVIREISYNSSTGRTEIEVRNIGQTDLDTGKFSLFLGGELTQYDSLPVSEISTDESVILKVLGNRACTDVRVVGEHNTADEYPASEQPGCA